MDWGSPRMLVAFTVATVATVALIVVLATGSWWALPIAMAGHLAAAFLVMRPTARALGQEDKPDPMVEARLEEEGRGPTGDRATRSPRAAGDDAAAPPDDAEASGDDDDTAPEDEPRMAI